MAATTTVDTDCGAATGFVQSSGVHTYLGIPFAQPPIGPLRWMPPQPHKGWGEQPLNATWFRPFCLQANQPANAMAEDCLFLNVGTPLDALKSSKKLPVMLWSTASPTFVLARH